MSNYAVSTSLSSPSAVERRRLPAAVSVLFVELFLSGAESRLYLTPTQQGFLSLPTSELHVVDII